jgi:succinate dehydrogenase hydrophobic membrane anchor protein
MKPEKEPGPAHSGMSDWYWQRLSAVVLAVLLPLPFLLLIAVYSGSVDHQGMLELLDNFWLRLLHTILISALIVHAYLGVKVIFEDYVHAPGLRVSLIGAMQVAMFSFAIWWLAMIWAWGG